MVIFHSYVKLPEGNLEWLIGGIIFTNYNHHRNEFDWWSHILHRSYIQKVGIWSEKQWICTYLPTSRWEIPINGLYPWSENLPFLMGFDGLSPIHGLYPARSPIFDGTWSISKLVDSAALHETDGCCLIFSFRTGHPQCCIVAGSQMLVVFFAFGPPSCQLWGALKEMIRCCKEPVRSKVASTSQRAFMLACQLVQLLYLYIYTYEYWLSSSWSFRAWHSFPQLFMAFFWGPLRAWWGQGEAQKRRSLCWWNSDANRYGKISLIVMVHYWQIIIRNLATKVLLIINYWW